ncbi:MAG: aldose 1-epimerase [Nocardioidaceae bacterium]|nr:aldose 1-epimerase [Nocardioidaceae bacterium]
MTLPSGEQHLIAHGPYRAVVTQSGATLRTLSYDGRDLVQGFGEDEMASAGRGQVLLPWPNRIRDGSYAFAGHVLRLPLSEPGRHNASHGLVRWVSWARTGGDEGSVTLGYRLMAQSGYPWTLDLTLGYALGDDGLSVTVTATNVADQPAPFAYGAHPYLTSGSAMVDDDVLTLPGATRLLTDDERKLPAGREPVAGSSYDFREGRRIGDTVVDHAFTDLGRDTDGRVRVTLRAPSGTGVELWGDEHVRWLQAYTGDDQPTGARTAVAVEPMTAPPDAFNSGDDLVVLQPGEAFTAGWGIRALD